MALICIIVFLQSFKKNSGTNALTVYLYMCSWGTSCGLLPSMMCTWCRTILWCIGRPYSAKEKKCSTWQAQIRWSTTERCDSPLSSEFRSISDPLCDHTVQDMQGGRPLSRGRSAPWRWKTTSWRLVVSWGADLQCKEAGVGTQCTHKAFFLLENM